MMFLFLFPVNISCDKCPLARNLSNIFGKIFIWWLQCVYLISHLTHCKGWLLWVCCTNQVGISEMMVRTAPALCTNSRFFALKILCTEINDWQQLLYNIRISMTIWLSSLLMNNVSLRNQTMQSSLLIDTSLQSRNSSQSTNLRNHFSRDHNDAIIFPTNCIHHEYYHCVCISCFCSVKIIRYQTRFTVALFVLHLRPVFHERHQLKSPSSTISSCQIIDHFASWQLWHW